MTSIFDPTLIDSHELYHARAGVGAVIAAIPKSDAGTAASRRRLGLHIAFSFNARVPRVVGSAPDFQRIRFIGEEAGLLRMTLDFSYLDPDSEEFAIRWTVIERLVPVHHVSLEIIHLDQEQDAPTVAPNH